MWVYRVWVTAGFPLPYSVFCISVTSKKKNMDFSSVAQTDGCLGTQVQSSRAACSPGFLPYQAENISAKELGLPGERDYLVGQKI